jgi:hypothetical protein
VFVTAPIGNVERNESGCCTNSRRSETQSQSAQRTPSTCAARECEQISQRLAGLFTQSILIKSDAETANFSSA